ncbi:MAG: hypothetical protein ACREA4_07495, partial [Nitrososphaera sp.]
AEELSALEARYPPGSMSRRIRMDGELLPGISGSLVYGAFAHETHVAPGLLFDERYPILWTWDFNVSPMCSLICQRHHGRLFVIRELWMEEGSIPEMCDLFRAAIPASYPVRIYGDATGKARTAQTRATSYQIIANELVSRGYNVKMHVPESNPSVVDRINTVNAAFASPEGESKVMIDASCKELIADMESVIYDSNNGIRKITSSSDPYHWRSHLSDALGYCISREMPIQFWKALGTVAISIRQARYGARAQQ